MNKKRSSNMIFVIECLVVLMVFIVAVTLLNQQSAMTAFKMWFYQVFCMLVPGCALIRLMKLRSRNVIQFVGLGYGAGYCVSILTYLAMIPLSFIRKNWMPGIRIANLAIAALASAYLLAGAVRERRGFWKRASVQESVTPADTAMAVAVWSAILALLFLAYGLPNRLPNLGSEQAYYFDTLYWIGNGVSLSRGFPPESIRGSGYILQYHYLSSMQLASIERTVGIPVSTLGLTYTLVQSATLMFFGLYCLFLEVLEDRWRIALGILLVYSMGDIATTNNITLSHLVTAPFGYDYGFALSCYGILLLVRLYRANKLSVKYILLYLIVLGLCVGVKAPNGILLLGFEGAICLLWLFNRKKRGGAIAFGIVSVVVCLGVYMVFMGNAQAWLGPATKAETTVAESESAMKLGWEGTSQYSTIVKHWFDDRFKSIPMLNKAVLAIRIVIQYCFRTNAAVFFLMICSAVNMFRNIRQDNGIRLACLLIFLAGTMMALFIPMVGYSQCYFIQGALIFGILMGLYPYRSSLPPDWAALKRAVAIPLIVVTLVNAYNYLQPVVAGAIITMKTGKICILQPQFKDANASGVVTPLEEEGYEWLRQNTDADALLVTNATVHLTSPLMTGVLSERRCWVESQKSPSVDRETADHRIEMIIKYYNYHSKEAYEMMREEGVDYAIVLNRFETGDEYTDNLECVYRNDDIRIYAL